jgi:hypothetical protein
MNADKAGICVHRRSSAFICGPAFAVLANLASGLMSVFSAAAPGKKKIFVP